jgi:hypothetical protein
MEMLSVPEGKETGGTVVLVTLFKTSKILAFPAAPLDPELALPPQAVSPINREKAKARGHL